MTKSNRHWYPRYPGDYARKTAHLTMMEHGAYALLMDHYYSNGPISWGANASANARVLQSICKAFAPEEIEAMHSVVRQFFIIEDDFLHQPRADQEIEKKTGISEKRRVAQAMMMAKRSLANAGAIAGANAPTATATATLKEENINQEDLVYTKNEIKKSQVKAGNKPKSDKLAKVARRLDENFDLPQDWGQWAYEAFGWDEKKINFEAEKFKDYWISKGKDATKTDWLATWRMWCRNALEWTK